MHPSTLDHHGARITRASPLTCIPSSLLMTTHLEVALRSCYLQGPCDTNNPCWIHAKSKYHRPMNWQWVAEEDARHARTRLYPCLVANPFVLNPSTVIKVCGFMLGMQWQQFM
jgi:hypothetical protein